MENQYDAVVVGSGPSGSLAGYRLAEAGLDVLIIDQSNFPRRKVCGGGLTRHALDQIPFDVSQVINQAVSHGHIGFRGKLTKTIDGGSPIAYMIERSTFDTFLLEKALAKGANAKLGQRFKSLQEMDDRILVKTDQAQYICRYLIGADGVHSTVAKETRLITRRSTSLAYEARLSLNPSRLSCLTDTITFDFGTLLFGYGWIFPKHDHLNVGVCRTWPGKKAGKHHLLRFIDQHPALHKDDLIDIRAFPVPLGGDKAKLDKNNILLVGDAANLADPWLGEGLVYALFSGQLAAETIIEHHKGSLADLASYTQKIHQEIVEQFRYARRFSLLVNILPYINITLLKSSRTLQKMIIDLLCGNRTYQQIWQTLIDDSPKILWQKLRQSH